MENEFNPYDGEQPAAPEPSLFLENDFTAGVHAANDLLNMVGGASGDSGSFFGKSWDKEAEMTTKDLVSAPPSGSADKSGSPDGKAGQQGATFGGTLAKWFSDLGLSDSSGKMNDASKYAMAVLGTGVSGLYKSYVDQKKLAVEQQLAGIKQQEQNIANQKFANIQGMKFSSPGILNYQPVTPSVPKVGG